MSDRASLPGWPRLMGRSKAAAYCDLAPAKFMAEVAAGRLPGPARIGGADHWDKVALDAALDRLFGIAADWRKEQPGLAA